MHLLFQTYVVLPCSTTFIEDDNLEGSCFAHISFKFGFLVRSQADVQRLIRARDLFLQASRTYMARASEIFSDIAHHKTVTWEPRCTPVRPSSITLCLGLSPSSTTLSIETVPCISAVDSKVTGWCAEYNPHNHPNRSPMRTIPHQCLMSGAE